MQLVTIDCREVAGRPGVMFSADEILDLAAAPTTLTQSHWIPQSVISVLAAGDDGQERVRALLDAAGEPANQARLRATGALLPVRGTALMPPVRRPGLILLAQPGQGATEQALIKSPNTAVGDGQAVRPPWRENDGLAVRIMLGVVLGRTLYQATADEANGALAAYTVLLDFFRPAAADGSLAAWWRHVDSMQFPGSCPVGPALATRDEFEGSSQVQLALSVNGHGGALLSMDLDSLPGRIAALSKRQAFRPGDLIGFGPQAAADDPRPLRAGDRVLARLDGYMTLEARVEFPA